MFGPPMGGGGYGMMDWDQGPMTGPGGNRFGGGPPPLMNDMMPFSGRPAMGARFPNRGPPPLIEDIWRYDKWEGYTGKKCNMEVLMKRSDPLVDKLKKMKELLGHEPVGRMFVTAKIDHLAHRTAVNVKNVYR